MTEQNSDYVNLVNLLSVFAEAKNRLGILENEAQGQFLDLVDETKDEYAKLQLTIADSQEAMEVIARNHPEWFVEQRQIKTPFGTVKMQRSTALEVKNEELSIALIKASEPEGTPLIRTKEELDLEELEKLSDEELKRFKVRRVHNENFSVKEAKMDLGKAVKASAKDKPKAA